MTCCNHSLPIITITILILCQSGLCHTVLLFHIIIMAGWVNWVLFLHTWIDLNAHLRFVLYSGSVDECDSLPLSFASWLFAIVFCIQLSFLAQTLALSMSLSVSWSVPLFVPVTRVYHLFMWLWLVPITQAASSQAVWSVPVTGTAFIVSSCFTMFSALYLQPRILDFIAVSMTSLLSP